MTRKGGHLPIRRGPRAFIPPQETHKINRRIRVPEVRLIGADGSQVGVVAIEDALRRAEELQLDLVEVAPMAKPPVCRILDYGKFKYQQHKKEAEARKKASTTTVKELRLSYRTDTGDIKRQVDKARTFLGEGDRVKFLLRFRGRELAYQDLGREKLMKVCAALTDIGTIESSPRMEGRMMGVVLAPGKRKSKPSIKEPSRPPTPAVPSPQAEPASS
jgi:translation initiation factor IF-3